MGEANFYYFTCLNYLIVILLVDTKTIMSSRGGRGGGGGRGGKRSSKGGRRHFTNPDELKAQAEEEEDKPKGVSHLIAIENPNRVKSSAKKVTAIEGQPDKTQLSRREREEIEKQEAHARYMKKHLAGETQEAQADLARLAIIRQRREEAAAKKAAAAEAAAAAADK